MATTNDNGIKMHQYQPVLTDAQLFVAPGEEVETDLDGTTEIETKKKGLPVKSASAQPWSDFSMMSSSSGRKRHLSRSYKFIQLERALTSTNLIQNNDDRLKFEQEYLQSLNENTFDEFLHNYYKKIRDHSEHIRKERASKKARIFTFFDLEKNFLALDPTRDVKIVFIDQSTASSISKTTNSRSNVSTNLKSTSSILSTEAATEAFYAHRSNHLLYNPARAREEITLFSRRAAERVQERLPRMTSVPHRVKIVDERDINGKLDERTLLQIKHKRALSSITKRHHIFLKMMAQTKKNQTKMDQQWKQTPLSIDGAACCRELLERANQIDQTCREERMRRPQTGTLLRRTASKINSSSASSEITTMSTNIEPTFSTPFQDALSIYHVEKTKNVRVIRPTRPFTAPTKVAWANYC